MFQYASTRGIAARHGYDWLVPYSSNSRKPSPLFDCFNMSHATAKNMGNLKVWKRRSPDNFRFDQKLFETCPDNTCLKGYFQSTRYFQNIEPQIRTDFRFKADILQTIQPVIARYENPIFIHVRRGDYLQKTDYHPICPLSYYQEALESFPSETQAFVLSDDPIWCRQNFTDRNKFIFLTDLIDADSSFRCDPSYYDLCLMSLCSGAIIANSSFSLWGAWLQDSRGPVIAPWPWFGTKYSNYDMSDLLPLSWRKLNYQMS